jgi:ParB-like chromosome segregation protein Spo0J
VTSRKKHNGMVVERVNLDSLTTDPVNARKGNIAAIAASLKEFGQHRPLVVQKSSMRIISGNHTFQAAATLGWEEIDVVLVDDDDTKAVRRAIADNATTDRATWDDEMLRDLLATVGEDVPGVDQTTLDRLAKMEPGEEPDEPIYPVTAKPGENYTYVVVLADTVVDSAWLETAFDLEKEQSYKSSLISKSRVVSVEKFRSLLPQMAKFVALADE